MYLAVTVKGLMIRIATGVKRCQKIDIPMRLLWLEVKSRSVFVFLPRSNLTLLHSGGIFRPMYFEMCGCFAFSFENDK